MLFETHTFLWWYAEDPVITIRAKEIIAIGQKEVFLSAASAREILIYTATG
jgi:PIN domain nuclease of toxin-antitoxin system